MVNSKWEYMPLSEVVEICDTRRKPINAKERAKRIEGKDESSLFPYYGATGQVGYIDDYLTDGEYVLLGEDGAPFLDAFANKAYIITGKAWVNNHAHILRSKGDNRFLCYYLNHFDFHDYVSGTTRLKLTQEQMKRIPVPVLPIEEQQRIVARIEELFSQLDDAEATLQKTKAQLSVYRQAVLSYAFSGALTDCASNGRIELGEIIEKPRYGTSKKCRYEADVDSTPVYRIPNIMYKTGIVTHDDIKYARFTTKEMEDLDLIEGDILLIRSNGSASLVGRAAIIRKADIDATFAGYLMRLRITNPKENDPRFLLWYLQSHEARVYIENKAKSTSGVNNINSQEVCGLLLPRYSINEQDRIIDSIESRISTCDNILQTVDSMIQQAQSLKQSVLKQVFEGE